MNFREIEERLKKERDEVGVPNVFPRVKKAPINRLLSSPSQAFQKQAAIRLLVFAFILFLAATIAMISMFSMPVSVKNDATYLCLNIQNYDGQYTYGLVIRGEKVEFACVETSPETAVQYSLNVNGKSIETAINEFYSAKTEDKISISVISDSDVAMNKTYALLEETLYRAGAECEITRGMSPAQTKSHLINLLKSNGKNVDEEISVNDLVELYAECVSAMRG